MAFEDFFSQEWKSIPSSMTDSENSKGCFDCNICLEFAHEPVVTLCGHLYCWPCIYKWLHVQSDSLASDEHPQCPVCKADISHTTMVPLYGRGQTPSDQSVLESKAFYRGMAIPPRPPACGAQALLSTSSHSGQQLPYRNPYQSQQNNHHAYQEEDSSSEALNLGSTMTPGFHHPLIGMFQGMVYARVFGNSESLYTNPNSYYIMGGRSPRLRRQEMQADKSLNRISIFLFCCFLLCLIVF
ncbi:E3 ubiquitin-protein ligase RMA1H1-like [Quillaja saponaria]|uniref:E3 ubiquitin-protein ligase RMA n=1 Tax=Quillaja saponaria TaxID=32244 RepID=A0AAD7P9T5_QUISA|nr:E3 ubiquitin-protein ligase RMA1H1-like [Quillaja saponaria]